MEIKQLVEDAHAIAKAKGWWDDDRNIPECLALIHSEVSEALEDYRVGRMGETISDTGKPEGFPSEMADIVIRVASLCGRLGIDLEFALRLKLEHNRGRAHRHGGKRA